MHIPSKFKALAAGAAVALLAGGAQADPAQGVEGWKAFAAQMNHDGAKAFAEAIGKPEALKLAKEWADLRGYDVFTLRAEADIPADIKGGLVITPADADKYPWLKDFLPAPTYHEFTTGETFSIGEIVIVPNVSYYMSKGTLEATKEVIAKGIKPVIDEKGDLKSSKGTYWLLDDETAGAIPFLNPKTGLEVHWTQAAHAVGTPNLHFRPITQRACTPDHTIEREYKADLWWQKMHGRRDLPPYGSVEGFEDVVEAGSIFFLEPFDVRGLAGVRKRFADRDETDDFQVFIPSLRRTRQLTGSDSQDPMAAGLELSWDEWRANWQKTDASEFDFQLRGDAWILAQPEIGHFFDTELTEDGCNVKRLYLELRPVWVYDVIDKTGRYQYSKRTMYIDKEWYYMQYEEMYDPRGNLLRVWDDVRDWVPETGLAQWRSVLLWNVINHRLTYVHMDTVWGDELVNAFTGMEMDVDQLRDYQ